MVCPFGERMSLVFYFKLFGILIPILAILTGIALLIVYVHFKVGPWLSISLSIVLTILAIVGMVELSVRF